MKKYFCFLLLLLTLTICNTRCKKMLDKKADQSLVIPTTLKDAQALLDNFPIMNERGPSAPEACADDYYLTYTDYLARPEVERRLHTWQKDNLFSPSFNNWADIYNAVYIANTSLEIIQKVDPATVDKMEWENIAGQAYFHRARRFFHAAIVWVKQYDKNTAATELGIPLRRNTNFNEPSVRASMEETYQQIIADLESAIQYLPVQAIHVMRPSKAAALGLLARVYHTMKIYDKAGHYAQECLKLKSDLVDYNTLNAAATNTMQQFNKEVLFHSKMSFPGILSGARAKIDSVLYNTYSANDLRRVMFFRSNNNGTYRFKGSYDPGNLFDGLAVDEMYLILAESTAREGNKEQALTYLNTLLSKRWKTGTFIPLTAPDANTALLLILQERRKELLMRGLRWLDIKRLNSEAAGITLKRVLNGEQFLLSPNDNRYALAIPEEIISLTGITQNP